MSINHNNEIEIKLNADTISIVDFKKFMFGYMPKKYLYIKGPDHYYAQNTNIVRHRIQSKDNHEITIKKRKSDKSIKDRFEIDIFFDYKTKPQEIKTFLQAAGFKHIFCLTKKAHIFWVQQGKYLFNISIYDVWKQVGKKKVNKQRFVEIEAEKGSDVSPKEAKRKVSKWAETIQKEFNLKAKSESLSLYEMFSGKLYNKV